MILGDYVFYRVGEGTGGLLECSNLDGCVSIE
jgi:hypothetical protein